MEMETIRWLRVGVTTTGISESTAALNQFKAAHAGIAQASEQNSRAFLAQDKALEGSIRKYDEAYRATKALEKATADFNRGFDSGRFGEGNAALAERSRLIGLATAEYEKSIASMQRGTGNTDRAGDIAAYGQELDRLRTKFSPLFAAQQQYKAQLSEISAAAKVGAITEAERAAAVMNTKVGFVGQVNAIRGVTDAFVANSAAGAKTTETAARASGVWNALTQSMSGVSGQLLALSAGAGPVGVFLSALGPWGVAGAVGIGALGAAFRYVEQESARMGDKSIALHQFSESTGLTAAQMSGLKHAAVEFGVTGESLTTGFERLTFGLNDARQATGTLFDQVREVNGGLADELTQTVTTAQGIDVLANAYRSAGSEAQKMAIARAVFGRGGSASGPVLGAIADAGGIAQLHATTEATDEQAKAWARMRAETEEFEKKAKNILASIFTQEGLELAHKAAELTLRVAKNVKEMASQREGLSGFQRFILDFSNAEPPAIPPSSGINEAIAADAARQRIAQGKGSNLGVDNKDIQSWHQLEDAMNGVVPQMDQVSKSYLQVQQAAQAASNLERERIGLLGAAATADEHRAEKLTELTAAFLKNKLSEEDYNRAINQVNYDASSKVLDGLQRQLDVLSAMPGQARLLATEEARVVELINEQKLSREQAGAIAGAEKQLTVKHADDGADQQLVQLQQQLAVIKAITAEDKIRAQAEATIANLMAGHVSQDKAEAVAKQQSVNALEQIREAEADAAIAAQERADIEADHSAQQESLRLCKEQVQAEQEYQRAIEQANDNVLKQTQSLQDQVELIKARKNGTEAEVAAEQALNRALAEGVSLYNAEALADATRDSIKAQKSSGGSGGSGGTKALGPDPYKDALGMLKADHPELFKQQTIGFDPSSGKYGAKDLPAAPVHSPFPIQQTYENLKTLYELQQQAQQEGFKRATDALNAQTDAANKNTDALGSVTSALSDFYNSDPRFTHLGYRPESGILDVSKLPAIPPGGAPSIVPGAAGGGGGVSPGQVPGITNPPLGAAGGGIGAPPGVSGGQPGQVWIPAGPAGYWGTPDQAAQARSGGFMFADGGVMTERGPVPLRRYAMGGIASSPQMAMYGEGSRPEAYVPLPDGRSIPAVVKLSQPAGQRSINIRHGDIIINGSVDQEAIQKIRYSMFQASQDTARSLRGHR